MLKNIAIVLFGVVVGASVVSNSHTENKPSVPKSEVVIGHSTTPSGETMVSYADGHRVTGNTFVF